jgi:hypothetical protein
MADAEQADAEQADAERAPRAYPRARAVVAAVLFIGWLCFLVYLVSRTDELVVVSRPQVLVSDVVVVAEVRDQAGQPDANVTVKRVLFKLPKDARLAGTQITLAELPEVGAAYGYTGAGDYVLALVHAEDGYRLTPLPTVPGFVPFPGEVRIYRATPDALAQVREVTE